MRIQELLRTISAVVSAAAVAFGIFVAIQGLDEPSPPLELSGTMKDGFVKLAWREPERPESLRGYQILRRELETAKAGDFRKIGTTENTERSYKDQCPSKCVYRVVAYTLFAKSAWSNFTRCVSDGKCKTREDATD